jgi:TIR domain-containing protein/pentapeptide repeat protein
MDRNEALRLLKGGGVAEWNRRRKAGEEIPPLREADLRGANLIRADLRGANLGKADLGRAALVGADLREAALVGAHLVRAYLGRADLREANLGGARLVRADLDGAHLGGADLDGADLREASLVGADLDRARCRSTNFADVDLSEIKGLESIQHDGPSTVGIDTLFRSQGKIPEAFLRGCGVPEVLITHLPSLIGAMSPIQFSSYFLSYSTKDEAFAQRLHSRLCDEGLRVWFAPEDVPGGKKLHEPSDEAIRVSDKLLLVLSPTSLNSAWVKTEIRQARKLEIQEGQRKLFPIWLVDFETLRDWECFDADSGQDLGEEIRESFIPDFLRWTEHDAFEEGFARLLRDLKAEDSTAE